MHLTPHELDKLILHQVGFLAQKRLARGLKLNYPEAIGLIATQILELIRDGHSVSELMDVGRRILGRSDVLQGVPEMISEIQIEGTFPEGSKLVTVHQPIVLENGDLQLALYGSFLPLPVRSVEQVGPDQLIQNDVTPGEILSTAEELRLNEGRQTVSLVVSNSGDRPIQVGSHYHFVETNRALVFDRAKTYGMRLDIPAGTAVRFEPGDQKTVHLVAIGGNRVIRGGNVLANGPCTDVNQEKTLREVSLRGFGNL